MRGTVAKRLRKVAQRMTIGAPAEVTRMAYQEIKRLHVREHRQGRTWALTPTMLTTLVKQRASRQTGNRHWQ